MGYFSGRLRLQAFMITITKISETHRGRLLSWNSEFRGETESGSVITNEVNGGSR